MSLVVMTANESDKSWIVESWVDEQREWESFYEVGVLMGSGRREALQMKPRNLEDAIEFYLDDPAYTDLEWRIQGCEVTRFRNIRTGEIIPAVVLTE